MKPRGGSGGPWKRRPRRALLASDLGTTVTDALDKIFGLKTVVNGTGWSASGVRSMASKIKVTLHKEEMPEKKGSETRPTRCSTFPTLPSTADSQCQETRLCSHDQINALVSSEEVKSEQIEDIPGEVQRDGRQRDRDQGD